MNIFNKLIEQQAELNMLRKNRDKLAGLQFTNTQELSRLRGLIEPLLLRIHLYEDMDARQEFDDVQSEMVELKELAKHIPSLLSQADSKIAVVAQEVKNLQAQVDKLEERYDYWLGELRAAETKLKSNPLLKPRLEERIKIIKAKLQE